MTLLSAAADGPTACCRRDLERHSVGYITKKLSLTTDEAKALGRFTMPTVTK
ncbi:MAG: hypothetical protein IPN95_19115 [Bacteroidetes bacterium]|nr:hypothetical protein [Bacteroidota bacterium]